MRHVYISELSEINNESFFRDKSSLKLGEDVLDSRQETLDSLEFDNLYLRKIYLTKNNARKLV